MTKEYSFLDVAFTYRSLSAEIDAAFSAVMDSGMYIGGSPLAAFEQAFAAYCEAPHCVGVGNGLDALALPLRARGIGPGDEVIVPAHTFIATWLAAAQTGATLVPVDVDPDTMNLSAETVAAALTPRTRAIIPVHLYGTPAPVDAIMQQVAGRDIFVLEDAAQAHGARLNGRRVGSLGHVAAFSFYPGKNLGAFGDAGAVSTGDADLAERIRALGNYGSREKYVHDDIGTNSRLDPLQAAFLHVKLAALDAWTDRRRAIAAVYLEALAGIADLCLPAVPQGADPVWHLFVVRYPRRDALRAALAKRGVAAALHYPIANHRSGAFRDAFGDQSFPIAEAICAACLSLPIGPHLSVADADVIAELVREALGSI